MQNGSKICTQHILGLLCHARQPYIYCKMSMKICLKRIIHFLLKVSIRICNQRNNIRFPFYSSYMFMCGPAKNTFTDVALLQGLLQFLRVHQCKVRDLLPNHLLLLVGRQHEVQAMRHHGNQVIGHPVVGLV